MCKSVHSVIPATKDDAYYIAQRLRQADREEVEATMPGDPVDAVMLSYASSAPCWVGRWDDEPVCVMGVTPTNLMAGKGSPWMLGTDQLDRHSKALLVASREVLQQMTNAYPDLQNYVYEKNRKSIRWLKWLGFEIHAAEPFGYKGLPFHRFTMRV
jgi:hypothetical protein